MEHREIETFVSSDGVRLWTVSQGEGVPLLLCNGGPGCPDYLAPVADLLQDMAQVIRFEPRGCGRSEHMPPYTLETCLSDVENIRRHFGLERWIIAGHSWGADLALIYALHYPERTLGFICISSGRVQNDRDWQQAYRQKLEQELEVLPDFEYPWNLEVNEQVVQSWKQFIRRPMLWREIAQLDVPALYVYGDRDVRDSWPVEQVVNALPNARFEMIHGADHFIWRTHAAQLQSVLNEFVNTVG